MLDRWVIVGCGRKKLDHPAPAAELYLGHYQRTAIRWARSVVTNERLLILSAKWGLVRSTEVIAPYTAMFPGGGSSGFGAVHGDALEPPVTDQALGLQIRNLGVSGVTITFAGINYGKRLQAASHGAVIPWNPFFQVLDRKGYDHRIGYQQREILANMGRMP